jgi:hypothetical protein
VVTELPSHRTGLDGVLAFPHASPAAYSTPTPGERIPDSLSFEKPRDPQWYKRALFYEVLVRGLHDSNGDDTGDLRGLTSRLDYLHIPGLAQEYERTCDDCGTSWRVPKAIAHPHMQGLPTGNAQPRCHCAGAHRASNATTAPNAARLSSTWIQPAACLVRACSR